MNPLDQITNNEYLAITHRQWIRADRVKEYFQQALRQTDKQIISDVQKFYLSDAGIFMLLWYSLLFSLLESLNARKVKLEQLDSDYKELYKSLRRLRNSVFHVEQKYWDMRQFELMMIDSAVQRIHHIHDSLGGYFFEALRNQKPESSIYA